MNEETLSNTNTTTKYHVNILAEPGWGTADELKALEDFQFKPNVLVWQYYLNDLDDCCGKLANDTLQSFDYPLYGKLSYTSNLFTNFLWLTGFIRMGDNKELKKVDADVCKQKHLEEMDAIVNYARSKNIPLLILFIPELRTGTVDNDVLAFFEKQEEKGSLKLINLTKELMQIPGEERMVNVFDAHASSKVHKLFGNALFEYIEAEAYCNW